VSDSNSTPATGLTPGWYAGDNGTQRYWTGTEWVSPVPPSGQRERMNPKNRRNLLLAVIALVVLLVGGYVGVVLALKRRRRARRHAADDPAAAVDGAWAEALDRLHEAAVVPRATQTPLDLASTVPAGTSPATARPMRQLARAYGAARYGDGAIAPDDARVAWESLDELELALDDGVSWTRRWRRRLDASTLVRR